MSEKNSVQYTGRFIMLSVITNIYNKKTKGPTLMGFFTTTGKLKKVFLTTRVVKKLLFQFSCGCEQFR